MYGHLDINAFNVLTGRGHKVATGPNLVLNGMYKNFINLLGGNTDDTYYVDRLQLGTGSTAPAVTDLFLQRPITPIKAVTPAVSEPYSVTYSAYLLADEGNGFPISEAGLLGADDTLVARKTFSAQTKTSSYIWGFNWTITTKYGSAPDTDYTVPVETSALASIMFGGMIVGTAAAGTVYGDIVVDQPLTLTGMQATVLGAPPVGSSLVSYLRVDGVTDTTRGVTVADGASSASGSFGTQLSVPAGTRLQVYVDSVGSTTPGDWVLFFYNLRVSL